LLEGSRQFLLLGSGEADFLRANVIVHLREGLQALHLVVGSENLIRPQILNLQRLAAELLPPVFRALAQCNAA
jgi:hypothetical protein